MKCVIKKNGIVQENAKFAVYTQEQIQSKIEEFHERKGVPIHQKVRNVTSAFIKWANAGFPKRSKEEIKTCMDKCRDCPFWNPKGNFWMGECTHPKCGCSKFKPQWATEHCPIGEW